jgi:CheY-like chemotaxis protein
MDAALLAAIGVVVQWGSSLLLFLFFLRLGHSGVRHPFVRTWAVAWAALVISLTGPCVHAIAVLLNDPAFGVAAARWLDLLNIPGALLFAVLAAVGVYQSVRTRAAAPVVGFVVPDLIVGEAEPILVVEIATPEVSDQAASEPQVAGVLATGPEERRAVSREATRDLPPRHGRTATLPLPPLLAHGKLGEVFLIDDEAAVRSTLARIFQRGGWPVRDASTGEEALAWLLDVPADDAPAVILCDFKMPGMGGQEVYAHLVQGRPELLSRIIFVTGDMGSESARAFIASTRCLVVEKPFTVSDIARAVEELLAVSLHAIG